VAPKFPLLDKDIALGRLKLLRQKLTQVSIGLAVDGRGGNGHLKLVAVGTNNLVPTGFRLNIEPDDEVVLFFGDNPHLDVGPEGNVLRQELVDEDQAEHEDHHREIQATHGRDDPADRGDQRLG